MQADQANIVVWVPQLLSMDFVGSTEHTEWLEIGNKLHQLRTQVKREQSPVAFSFIEVRFQTCLSRLVTCSDSDSTDSEKIPLPVSGDIGESTESW